MTYCVWVSKVKDYSMVRLYVLDGEEHAVLARFQLIYIYD